MTQSQGVSGRSGSTAPPHSVEAMPQSVSPKPHSGAISLPAAKLGVHDGRPMMVPVSMLYEDANNPRTDFPEDTLDELAVDIRHRGVLQPLVVHPADDDGRHQVHFGAKRLRAAIRAGLHEVPAVVRDLPADRDAQVAENQKRHGLTPLELARFIRAHVDAGDSNATIARQLGINLTAVAHHLSLLELPPVLDDAPALKASPQVGCRGLTVRPLRRPNAEPMESGAKWKRKDRWQDRRAASEWMPCGIRREVRRGGYLA